MTLQEFSACGRMVSDHHHFMVDENDDLNRFDALLYDDGTAALWDVRNDQIVVCRNYADAMRRARYAVRDARKP